MGPGGGGGGPTNGQTAAQVQATVANNAIAQTNGSGLGTKLTNAAIQNSVVEGATKYSTTNTGSGTASFFSDYDPNGPDFLIMIHGGSEFFYGITNNTGSKSYIDFNIDETAEYNVTASTVGGLANISHTFYLEASNQVAIDYFDVTTNGARSPQMTATNFVGGGASITNLNGANITAATIPRTAADGTWAAASNYLHTIGPLSGAMVPIFNGVFDSFGAPEYTNASTSIFGGGGGSQTPWTSDIDAAAFSLLDLTFLYWTNTTTLNSSVKSFNTASGGDDGSILSFQGRTNNAPATISLLADRFIAQQQVRVQGGSISVIPTNAAPVSLVTNASGTSLPMGLTNVFVGRGQPVVRFFIVDAVTGTPIITFSNEQTGVRLPISYGSLAFIETNFTVLPETTTNSVWRVRDESTGSGVSVGILTNWIIGL